MAEFDLPTRLLSLFGHRQDPKPPRAPIGAQPQGDPWQGTPGGARNLDYAAPYVDVSVPDMIRAFVLGMTGQPAGPHAPAAAPEAPKKLDAPEKPEGAEVHSFGFENFRKMGFTAADWQDAPRTAERPRKREPAPASPPNDRKWSIGTGEGAAAGGVHRTTMTTDPDATGGVRTTQTGAALDSHGNVSVARRDATDFDAEGNVRNGNTVSGGVGLGGANLAASKTTDGKTASFGMQVNPISGETAMSGSYGGKERSLGVTVGHKGDTSTVGISGKYGPVSANVGFSETSGIKKGKIGDEGIDATLHDFVGDGTYVERDSGHTVSGGGDVEYGPFGAGGSGYKGSLTKRRHFKAGKEEDDKPGLSMFAGMPGMAPPELMFDGVADIDVDKLKKGEGYSIEQSKQAGGEGHIKAGITIGLGKDNAEMSQTVLARDANGDIRVMVAQGDENTLTGSISASKVASVSAKESKANMSQVAFTAHGPEGTKAVKEFQQTGLLPGADRLAKLHDPAAVETYAAIKQEWDRTVKAAEFMKDYGAIYFKSRLDELREKMCEAAGPLNDAFLKHRGQSLDAAGVPGVRYDSHVVSDQSSKDVSLALAGKQVLHSGSKENDWDAEYRAETGEAHVEQGHNVEDTYAFSKDESSTIAMDPKGQAKARDPVAMVLSSKQGVTQRERNILAKLGPAAFDMPAETIEAWRDGSMNESQLAHVAVTMTEGQLAKIRDKLAIPDLGRTAMIKTGAGAFYEQVQNGGRDETAFKASRGDADAKRDVERYQELNDLYAAAAAARARQMLGLKDSKVNNGVFQTIGMAQMLSAVDHVKTPEDFLKLTAEEQKLVVVTGAMTMQATYQSPYECMRLVLQVKDPTQRNDLVRQLFATTERRVKGADAAVDFVQWVQTSGEAQHVPKEEMAQLLSGVAVRSEDPDTKEASSTHDFYELVAPGLGNDIIGKKLAGKPRGRIGMMPEIDEHMDEHLRQRSEEKAADRITDLLQSARGEKRDARAVEAALASAAKENPEFVAEMWETLDKDPARAAWANYLLEGTRYHREPARK